MCCLKINNIYAAVTLTFEVALQVIYASQTTKVGVSSCLSFEIMTVDKKVKDQTCQPWWTDAHRNITLLHHFQQLIEHLQAR